ncbi:MAG TPA: peptidylprolyl isomerase [Armatimonadota bacterium]|jgi:peptidyl-prolyl cis-trans isomerase B (cyclophilin B)
MATYREARKYGVPADTLWNLVVDTCRKLGLEVGASDQAAGTLSASQIEEAAGASSSTSYDLRVRPAPDQPEAMSVQIVVQNLLALEGGSRLEQTGAAFFQRLEQAMTDTGLKWAPPPPSGSSLAPRKSTTMYWVAGTFVVVAVLAILSLSGVFSRPGPPPPAGNEAPAATNSLTQEKTMENLPTPAEAKGSVVKINTAKGDIVIELFDKEAPITAGNFLLLAKSGYYNGVTFHRVVPDFVIQGGDPTGTGGGGPGFTIPDELKPDLKHDRGMLSMAKTAAPDTGGSQFFIVTGGPATVSHLNMKHAVFGRVLQGMDVVDKIVVGDKMVKVTIEKESPDAPAAEKAAEAARVKH